MTWAALTSGRKDLILTCPETIDHGNTVEYEVTAHTKIRDSYRIYSANRFPVIADVVRTEFLVIPTGENTEKVLADECGKCKSTLPDARHYSNSIRFMSLKIVSEFNNYNELVPGGFA